MEKVFVWHDGMFRAGIKFGEDAPPIMYGCSVDQQEDEIAGLKEEGKKIIRVDHESDLDLEVVFE